MQNQMKKKLHYKYEIKREEQRHIHQLISNQLYVSDRDSQLPKSTDWFRDSAPLYTSIVFDIATLLFQCLVSSEISFKFSFKMYEDLRTKLLLCITTGHHNNRDVL